MGDLIERWREKNIIKNIVWITQLYKMWYTQEKFTYINKLVKIVKKKILTKLNVTFGVVDSAALNTNVTKDPNSATSLYGRLYVPLVSTLTTMAFIATFGVWQFSQPCICEWISEQRRCQKHGHLVECWVLWFHM